MDELLPKPNQIKINHQELLPNPVFNRLFMKDWDLNMEIIDRDLTGKEFQQAIDELNKQRLRDEAATLQTEEDRFKYKYFRKFKDLEMIKEELDPGIYEIMLKFNYLPFRSLDCCTGHVKKGTNELENDFMPAISFAFDFEANPQENETQLKFLNAINTINKNISGRLGKEGAVFDLRGEVLEWENGTTQELSPQESLNQGLPLYLFLNVLDQDLAQNRGRETLQVMWEEFIKAIDAVYPNDLPNPDFKKEEMFSPNPKSQESRIIGRSSNNI
jgi:hypothetical protein